MTVLPIYVAPHPVLKAKAEPVANVTDDTRKIMDDMLDTMYSARGIGLAATQVGIMQRIVVMDFTQREDEDEVVKGEPLFFVNPKITWTSDDINVYNEGCLSIPGQYADVERPARVKFTFLGRDGKQQEMEADGILATCIQHEIDHLDGILFTDHISKLKRDMLMKKLKKWIKDMPEDLQDAYIHNL